jgi:hypothetical protein
MRNNCDCKAVDLLNTRKRYTVIASLDLMRIIPYSDLNFNLWICKVQKKDTE